MCLWVTVANLVWASWKKQTFKSKNVKDCMINSKLSDIIGSNDHCETQERRDIICMDVAQSRKQRIQVSGLFPIMPPCSLILYLQLFIHAQLIALSASQALSWGTFCTRTVLSKTHNHCLPPAEGISGDLCYKKGAGGNITSRLRGAGPNHCCGAFIKISTWRQDWGEARSLSCRNVL